MKKAILIVLSLALIGSSAAMAQGQTKRMTRPNRTSQLCVCDLAEMLGMKAEAKPRQEQPFDKGTLPPTAKTQKRNH